MAKQYTAKRDDNSKVVAVGAAALGSLALLLLLRGRKEGVGLDLEIAITDPDSAPVSGIKITIVGDGTSVTTGADGKGVILGAGEAGDQLQIQISDPLGEYQPVDPQPVTIVLSDDDAGVCRRSYIVVPSAVMQYSNLTARVTSSAGGYIGDAVVGVTWEGLTEVIQVPWNNSEQAYILDGVIPLQSPPLTISLNAVAPGHDPNEITYVADQPEESPTIELTATGAGDYSNLTVQVASSAGGYLNNASVYVAWPGQTSMIPVPWSSTDGAYILNGVIPLESPALTVSLYVEAPGHDTKSVSYVADQVEESQTVTLDVITDQYSDLVVVLTSSEGGFISNANVFATWLGGAAQVVWDGVDQNYKLLDTIPLESPALTVALSIDAPMHEPQTINYEANQASVSKSITLTYVPSPPDIQVFVYDDQSYVGINAASVALYINGAQYATKATSGGGFVLFGDAANVGDTGYVVVTKAGYDQYQSASFTVPDVELLPVNVPLHLTEPTVALTVTVYDLVKQEYVGGALVQIRDWDYDTAIASAGTNTSGVANFDDILHSGDRIRIVVTKTGYNTVDTGESGVITMGTSPKTVNLQTKAVLGPQQYSLWIRNPNNQPQVISGTIVFRDAASLATIASRTVTNLSTITFGTEYGLCPGMDVYIDVDAVGWEFLRYGPVMLPYSPTGQYVFSNVMLTPQSNYSNLDITVLYWTGTQYSPLSQATVLKNGASIGQTNSSGKLYVANGATRNTTITLDVEYAGWDGIPQDVFCDESTEVITLYVTDKSDLDITVYVGGIIGDLPVAGAEVYRGAPPALIGTTNAQGKLYVFDGANIGQTILLTPYYDGEFGISQQVLCDEWQEQVILYMG